MVAAGIDGDAAHQPRKRRRSVRGDFKPATLFAAALSFCLASCLGAEALAVGWVPIGEAILSTGNFLRLILA